jgi:hypothetical protein
VLWAGPMGRANSGGPEVVGTGKREEAPWRHRTI